MTKISCWRRGDGAKAEAQLNEASEKARAIDAELLASNPTLRTGSFSNAIEELAEARLTQVWFEDESRTIAPPSHAKFGGLVQTIEYLGGLGKIVMLSRIACCPSY